MKKVIIEFNIDSIEAEIQATRAMKANCMAFALREIQQEIFRPARKHGYTDYVVNDLLDKCSTYTGEDGLDYHIGVELIGTLESMFNKIIENYELWELIE